MKKTLIIAVVIATVALLGIRAIVGKNIVSEASVAKASILGMSVQDSKERGVHVAAVHANSMAEQKGIQPNDVTLAVDSITDENQSHYQQALDKAMIDNDVILHMKGFTGEVKIHLDMESAAAYNNLGNAYMKDRQHEQAINAYKKALEFDPKFSEAYYRLAKVYDRQGKREDAIRTYKELCSSERVACTPEQ
ncbi:tetratricopeptide repeat protein [Candidatus Poribacteria bacterium]